MTRSQITEHPTDLLGQALAHLFIGQPAEAERLLQGLIRRGSPAGPGSGTGRPARPRAGGPA